MPGGARDPTPSQGRKTALHHVYLSRGERLWGVVLIPRRYSLAEAGFGRLIGALDRLMNEHPPDHALEGVETWLVD
jgi:hypothetical protein